MQKNKKVFFLLLLALGCDTGKRPQTLFSRWKSSIDVSKDIKRKIASDAPVKCLHDLFTVENLKQEAKELEESYINGPRITGTWRHLNLENLPFAQANFLKTYGNEIGDLSNPDAIDYSSCSDVPCIFNKIYGEPDGVAGYVHYIWYLRMGNMLSADNFVPLQDSKSPGIYNSKSFPLSSYLYNYQELYGFWRTTRMLNTSFATLKNLKEIQLIPRGEYLERRQNKLECGLNQTGSIIFSENCLSSRGWPYSEKFYEGLIHELAHSVDRQQGEEYGKYFFSATDEFLDISSHKEIRFKNEKNEIVRWMVSDYSAISPQENFAETLAFFRIYGDLTKSKITDKYFDYTSKKYFESKSYEDKFIFERWIKDNSSFIMSASFNAIKKCGQSEVGGSSDYFSNTDFNSKVPLKMLNCLGVEAEQIAYDLKVKLSGTDPDACVKFIDSSYKWSAVLKTAITATIETYLEQSLQDNGYLASIQKFTDELFASKISNEAYLKCLQRVYPEICYESEVRKMVVKSASFYKLPASHADELAEQYYKTNPYSKAKNESDQFYFSLIKSHQELLKASAQDLWDVCDQQAPNDVDPPTGSASFTGSGYIISSYYNCITTRLPETTQNLARSITIGGQKTLNGDEEGILIREVKYFLQIQLRELYLKSQERELTEIKTFVANDNGNLKSSLLSNTSWMNDPSSKGSVFELCLKEGLKRISFNPKFNQKKEAFSDYLNTVVCKGVDSSAEYKKLINDSREDVLKSSIAKIESMILIKGTEAARACVSKLPIDTALNRLNLKSKREDCLISKWQEIERSATDSQWKMEDMKKYNISVNDLSIKLESNRRRLQLKIMKENF